MKDAPASAHSWAMEEGSTLPIAAIDAAPRALPALEVLFRDHASFVWRSLHRLGVREADLADVTQEVFVLVQKRLDTFDGTSRPTTWLFGIAARVAANHRRAARHHREDLRAELPERADPAPQPEHAAQIAELRAHLHEALDRLSAEHRTAFVMFEIEGLACEEIARELEVPIGTVYSRVHHAKKRLMELLPRELWGGDGS